MLLPDTATAQNRPSMDVITSMDRLLRNCPRCSGYAAKPPICFNEWVGPTDTCPLCSPVRNWFYTVFAIDFGALT